jgi:hypothetical protein
MKFAYADPPYLGCGAKFYQRPEWDTVKRHAELVAQLVAEYPDGWVMSLHTPSLKAILPLCPDVARVGAWVKPFASFKPNVSPAYCWEPVIWMGGRKRTRDEMTVRDYHSEGITLKRGFTGAKPEGFSFWVFDLLGMQPDDEFVDLFPGSGAVSVAWEQFQRHPRLAPVVGHDEQTQLGGIA